MGIFNLRNFIILIVIIVGINYYRSSKEIDVQSLTLPLDTKILAFGDSLTYGYGATSEQSYPSRLSELLHSSVINEGVSGEMSAQGLARLPSVLARVKPDILVLCHGANDLLRKNDEAAIKENLTKMVTLAQSQGIYVLLVGVPTLDIIQFNVPSFYYDVAKENNVMIEDESLKTIFQNDDLKSDQIHPNAQGYALMAKKIAYLLSEYYVPSAKPF
jgi:lysophospholipase L1-like esterase